MRGAPAVGVGIRLPQLSDLDDSTPFADSGRATQTFSVPPAIRVAVNNQYVAISPA
jgi:hypothetical protein